MKNTVVIYHANCLDGFGAAYAAWLTLGNCADYIPAKYGSEPPDVRGKHVYILDFSYPRDVLIQMCKDSQSMLVLDHHKTAQKDLEGLPFAKFDMTKSGCILAWERLNHFKAPPRLLSIIQDRDLWQFKLDGTKEITAALYSFVPFEFKAWEALDIDELYLRGKDLLLVQEKDVNQAFERRHEIYLDGHTGLACNAIPKLSSDLGHKLATESGTFGAVYYYDGERNKWCFSLRSNGDFDVSTIAKTYGGGGHKNAAGFEIDTLSLF